MARVNSLNIRVSGTDFRVNTSGDVVIGGQTWEPYTEAMTAAQWNTATGLTARQIINPWDTDNVTFTADNDVSQFSDKSGGIAHLDVLGLVNLLKDGGRNVAEIVSAFVGSDDLATYLSGNSFAKPFVVGLCYKFSQIPSSEQTLWSCGHSSTTGRRSLSVTTNGYLKYAYADDSGNTLTVTGTDAIPLGTPCIVWLACERSKVRVYMHGGVWDHKKAISAEGAFNTTSTITQMAVGGYYTAGATSQSFASGYYLGHVFADGVCKNTYEAIEATCSMFNVAFATSDVSDFATGLISLIQGPGAGSLTTPKADVVDLITGDVFTATGTQPAAGTGKFHNAMGLAMTASTVYMKGTVPAIWDIYSGSYGDYTIYIRHKTGTTDASTRNIVCLNTTAAPTTQNVRVQQSTTQTFQLIVDNSTKATSTVTVTSDTWYDFVIKGSSGTHTFSVNGETPISFTPGTRSTVGGYFALGAMMTASNTIQHPGRGTLDCLALWNRALSSDEIVQLRNAGNARDGFFEYLQSETASGGGGGTLRYIGTMVAADGNANYQLKGSADYTSSNCTYITFVSPYSGSLREMTMWFKTASGYGGGNYGTYELEVRTDSAGAPSATVVSSVSGVTGFTANGSANSNQYRRITFTSIGSVTAGQKYHLVIRNTDASPNTNWTSLNVGSVQSSAVSTSADYTQARPVWVSKDFMYHHLDGSWLKGTPTLTLGVDTNADSTTDAWFGFPMADPICCYSGGNYSDPIGGAKQTRIRVKVSSNFQVVGASIAAIRTSGTGDVTATLKTSGGTVLATAILPGSQFNQQSVGTARTNHPYWSYGLFDANPTLTSGNTYHLDLSAPSGTLVYPNVYTNTADSINGNFLATMDGTKGGWWGSTIPLQSSTNGGSTFGTYAGGGSTNRSMAFYLSGY